MAFFVKYNGSLAGMPPPMQFMPNCHLPMEIPKNIWPNIDQSHIPARQKFSKAEDELLRRLVAEIGESNWSAVAARIGTRSSRQCRERYKNYLSPKIVNGPWTEEEETLLSQKVTEFGQKWTNIALFFETRSDANVKNHWAQMVGRLNREKAALESKAKCKENILTDLQSVQIEDPPLYPMQESEFDWSYRPAEDEQANLYRQLGMQNPSDIFGWEA